MILMGMVKHSRSSQNSKFAMSLLFLKKEVGCEVYFCVQIKIKVSYKLILSLLIQNSQSTQSNKFVISLQYLKKKLETEYIFACRQTSKFQQVGIILIMVCKIDNIFAMYKEKSVTTTFVLIVLCKTFRYLELIFRFQKFSA